MGKVAKIFAPTPPPPPPPPRPLPVKETAPAVAEKSKTTREQAGRRRGVSSTRLTGGLGVMDDPNLARKSLLG